MAARSTGMFPKVAAWVDTATTLPSDGSLLEVPNLKHSAAVTFVAFVTTAGTAGDQAAAPHIEVRDENDKVLATIPGDAAGKFTFVRSGIELGDVTKVKAVVVGEAGTATAPAAQVSIF